MKVYEMNGAAKYSEDFSREERVVKKHRSSMNLAIKKKIIDRVERGERAVDVARSMGFPPSTVRTIVKNAPRILELAQQTSTHSLMKITRQRSSAMEEMETMLALWLRDLHQQHMPISLALIQEKARIIFTYLKDKEKKGKEDRYKEESFGASRGWFHRFQTRYGFKNISLQRDAVTGNTASEAETHGFQDTEVYRAAEVEAYQEELKKMIEERVPKECRNTNEIGQNWRHAPKRTYISVSDKSENELKTPKEQLLKDNFKDDGQLRNTVNEFVSFDSDGAPMPQDILSLAKEVLSSESLSINVFEPDKRKPADNSDVEQTDLTVKSLQRVFGLVAEAMNELKQRDSMSGRSSHVERMVMESMSCYREILDAKVRADKNLLLHHPHALFDVTSLDRDGPSEMQNSITELTTSVLEKSRLMPPCSHPPNN